MTFRHYGRWSTRRNSEGCRCGGGAPHVSYSSAASDYGLRKAATRNRAWVLRSRVRFAKKPKGPFLTIRASKLPSLTAMPNVTCPARNRAAFRT